MRITPVILAGGEGRRLRPLTSSARAKPFLKLFSDFSLLQHTLMRVSSFAAPVIVGAAEHKDEVVEHAAAIGCVPDTIICEPAGRSTTAAITMAALELSDPEGDEPIMAIMPSDQLVGNSRIFQDTLMFAAEAAEQFETVVLLGVRPRSAATRYGYIQTNVDRKIEAFIEKPNKRTAKALIEKGQSHWNTGVFCVRPQKFLFFVRQYAPEIYTRCTDAYRKGIRRGVCVYPQAKSYVRCPSVAVDYAIMERLTHARCMTLETGWRDMGAWSSVYDLGMKKTFKSSKSLTHLR